MSGLSAALLAGGLLALSAAVLLAGQFGSRGFPLPPGDRRIGCVDGLRGLLALSVLVHHFYLWIQVTRLKGTWTPPAIHVLNQLGAGGVALFFMTTGLVFYPRILAGWRRTSWGMVYITRVARIVPLVTLSVGLVTAIVWLRTGAMLDVRYLRSALHWVSTTSEPPLLDYPDSGRINAYVLWSLKFEWLFYIFILPASAAIMDVIMTRRLPTWMFPVALFCVSIVMESCSYRLDYSVPMLKYLPLFVIGMLAFECQAKPAIVAFLSKPVVGALAIACLFSGMMLTQEPYTFSLPLFGLFFICVACGNSLGGLLKLRGALVLGEVSFGIYLLHGIMLDTLFVDAQLPEWRLATAALPLMLPVVVIIVVLLSSLTYLAVERPAIRLGRVLALGLAGRRARLDSRAVDIAP